MLPSSVDCFPHQALEGPQQELTPLGHHLATLPVDVRIGKMLLFGRCETELEMEMEMEIEIESEI